jgi:gliding motility-associated-like protein/uncharacterized repeat protein (TIGR01451 family)
MPRRKYYLTIIRFAVTPRAWVSMIVCFFLLLLPALKLFADGSKELSTNGGYRAYLFSSNTGNASFPFPTLGTMKVYVKAGETIYVGSSAQGIGAGTINLRAPDGTSYTSGNSAAKGLIGNRNQEKAGPLPNVGGYTPFTKTAQTGQDGVWEIDFIATDNTQQFANPDAVPVDANWTQQQGQYISAFDISVRDADNTKFIPGRVFTNVFSGILGTFNVGFNGVFNILTKDGYQYTLNNNGQAGNGFTFFVNNKGFRNADGTASYKSINSIDNPNTKDPRDADTQSDITQKIFFEPPAPDLPASANTPEGTTWLLIAPGAASAVSDVGFTGVEGTAGKGGTAPLGGNFTFNSPGGGTYTIAIDVNQNGIFTDAADRTLTGTVAPGPDTVRWDGLDGSGNKVTADTINGYKAQVSISTTAGEVHFPFFDVERNLNGILLTRLNGANTPDNVMYWNDTPITAIGTPSNPIKNLIGINSLVNGHKWGSAASGPDDDADFGNNKGIDTWAYIPIAPVVSTVGFKLYEADLEISSIQSSSGCTGQPIIYTVTVTNNGPNDVYGAKFRFSFPVDISGVSASSAATTGASSSSAGMVSANAYDADVNIANGSIRTFTITGRVAQSSNGNINTSASIMRPADVTDHDATNPDAMAPTDPVAECNSLPSGSGCNNIKTNLAVFTIAPNAGPDQTVYQYSSPTISAANAGTWSQAIDDPAILHIDNPSAASTTISGLNNLGIYHFINTNINGCTDTVALTVITADITIPNIFTPNGDGKNDVFEIRGLEAYTGSQLFIYNRWGNEVYKSANYLNNWDGSGLAEGTYYYLLNRKNHDGTSTAFKGWVFLKRTK